MPIAGLLPPAAVVWVGGWRFVTASHSVPGWVWLPVAALDGLSVVLLTREARRLFRHQHSTLSIQVRGPAHRALIWSAGTRGKDKDGVERTQNHVIADVLITSLVAEGAVLIPRSLLRIRYRAWSVIPAVREVDSFGPFSEGNPGGKAA